MPERDERDDRQPSRPPPPRDEPSDVAPERAPSSDLTENRIEEIQLEPRVWAILAHLTLFLLPVLGPLLILGLQGNILGQRSELVTHHGKQAVVWQVATIVIGIVTIGFGAIVMGLVALYASVLSGRGELYEYPLVGSYASRAL